MNAPEMTQSLWVIPLPNVHRPVSRYPPGTRSARPTGNSMPAVTRSRAANISRAAGPAMNDAYSPVQAPMCTHQPAEASP
jgi:hypothetical protein